LPGFSTNGQQAKLASQWRLSNTPRKRAHSIALRCWCFIVRTATDTYAHPCYGSKVARVLGCACFSATEIKLFFHLFLVPVVSPFCHLVLSAPTAEQTRLSEKNLRAL
jgi:hypothetical protein